MKISNKIKFLIKDNGLLAFSFLILKALKNRLKYKLYACLYGFDHAWFGVKPFLINIKKVKIGKDFYAERYLRFEVILHHHGVDYQPVCIVGNNVRMSDYCHIGCCSELIIGDDVLIGSNVFITDHSHGNYSGCNQSSPEAPPNSRCLFIGSIEIGNNVFIGDGVTILPNVKIGHGAIIAANSVVVSGTNIPMCSIYGGSPAKLIKSYINNEWV